jgi:hypothetical protein
LRPLFSCCHIIQSSFTSPPGTAFKNIPTTHRRYLQFKLLLDTLFGRSNPSTNIGRRPPSSAKLFRSTFEMSSKNPTKEKAPAASHSQEDTITVSESQPPPAHSTRSKGKEVARHTQAQDSSIAQISIPSGSRAVDESTPVRHTVEGANDQLRSEGIRRPSNQTNYPSPEDWAAVQQEIAALRTANQELLRQLVDPEQGGYQTQGRRHAAPKRNNKHRRHSVPQRRQQRRNTRSKSRDRHTDAGTPIGNPRFHQKSPGGPPGPPSDGGDDLSSNSSNSDRSNHASDRHQRSPRLSRKVNDPDKLDDGADCEGTIR